ncbi:contact-dependent growth inhibition system immunity protein [Streptomyces sp. TRM70308]|uniref:contact-dependent growth inhibition system immunity protein n=1 Tax=Streptomyces sp. TRM70308 TaxID=3131932 RepID=UPI003D043E73
MPMQPLQHDRKYGELDQVVRAYIGQDADDTPEHRSSALEAFLRHAWHSRPWTIGVAEEQIRAYVHNPPGRLKLKLGEFYPVPDVGIPETHVQQWLLVIADHLKTCILNGEVPPPGPPRTHWEWHARFPELAQLLGGWFSQDMPDEFPSHAAALTDYVRGTDAQVIARVRGEVVELLSLDLAENECVLGLAELGMEVDPPPPHTGRSWLALVSDRLGVPVPRADE